MMINKKTSIKIGNLHVNVDEYTENLLRKGQKVVKDEGGKSYYQSNTFPILYPEEQIFMREALSFEISLPTAILIRKIVS